MKVTMLGTGNYSIALALMIAKKDNIEITLWSENNDYVKEFKETHKISKIFSDVILPESVSVTNSYEEALKNTDAIFIACAARFVDDVCMNIKNYYHSNIPICIASKGIEEVTGSFLSNIVKKVLKAKNICVLSGPTFAIDMVNNEPVALALAGTNNKVVSLFKNILSNDTLKIRKSSDIIGIQICGSVKNIIAIASGIIKGLGYSESTNAFLINEALHDIKYLIHALGGKKKTVLSYAGVGDLLLTCTSTKSRNYSFGYVIGSTKDKKEIDEYLKNNTVEGYYTLSSIYKLVKKRNIDIPIINLIYDIVMNEKDPSELARFLISKK